MFSLFVVLVPVRGVDGVDQGEVDPDAADVYNLFSFLSRRERCAYGQVGYQQALCVVFACVFDSLHLLLVLQDLLR
eukprot:1912566-Pleurochrysis_carterae.AAC.1